MPTVHLVVKGKVQGVFYRASAREVAEELQLTGWVKNTIEGNVEVLVTGSEEHLEKFIGWCRQGPARAVVTEVQITVKTEEAFDRFRVLR